MSCDCSSTPTTLIYACSGAANTGLLSDQVARTLAKEGSGKMTCLAALGAELAGFQASAAGAARNLVLDGCPVACGAKIFERASLPFKHILMTDLGVKKGETVINTELIAQVSAKVQEALV